MYQQQRHASSAVNLLHALPWRKTMSTVSFDSESQRDPLSNRAVTSEWPVCFFCYLTHELLRDPKSASPLAVTALSFQKQRVESYN